MTANCLCGGVRIMVTGKVGPLVHCHCRQCQRASGTAFSSNVNVRRTHWQLTSGEHLIREFESSPGKYRAFCSQCGSPIYSRWDAEPDMLRLRLGLVNEDPERRALAHFWVESKAAWFPITDALPQFPRGTAERVASP